MELPESKTPTTDALGSISRVFAGIVFIAGIVSLIAAYHHKLLKPTNTFDWVEGLALLAISFIIIVIVEGVSLASLIERNLRGIHIEIAGIRKAARASAVVSIKQSKQTAETETGDAQQPIV